jgi:hypothetical protein
MKIHTTRDIIAENLGKGIIEVDFSPENADRVCKEYWINKNELIDWIESEIDNGNTDISISELSPPLRGFSAAICLSDLKKILETEVD